jgi:SAM-dependent methyltransferase
MRKSWGARTQTYLEEAAPNTAEHTKRLFEELAPQPGQRVLDVATGPGVVAIAAALAVGPDGEVVATDLTPEWGPVVAERAKSMGLSNVTFTAMGAEALDLPDDAFDLAYCQFGLMFVPEPVRALREMRRVLKPDGRLGVVVWSTADRVPCIALVNRHLAPLIPPDAPERQLPTPVQLGEPGLIERLVTEAGFAGVRAVRHTLDFVSGGAEEMWHGRVENGPPHIQAAYKALSAEQRERLRGAVYSDLERYRSPDGKIRLPSEAIYVTARKG